MAEERTGGPGGLRRPFRGWFLIFLALGTALTAGIAMVGDLKGLLLAGGMDYGYLPLILVLAPLNYCLRYVKWRYFLRRLGILIPEGQNLIIFTAGLGLTLTPGKAGELLKSYLLWERWEIPVTTTAPVVVAERLTDGVSLLILASLGSLHYRQGGTVLLVVGGAMGAFILFMQTPLLATCLRRLLGKIPLLRRALPFLAQIQACFRQILQPTPLLYSIGLGVVSWAFEGLVLYLAVQALGGQISPLGAIFIVSFSAIIGAISFLPGGLVAVEGTILGLLLAAGLATNVAAAATIITRFSTLWLGVALGVVGLFLA